MVVDDMKQIESSKDVKIGDFVIYKGKGIEIGKVSAITDTGTIEIKYIYHNVWKEFSGNGFPKGCYKELYHLNENEILPWLI